jgi:hypothetical protein
MMTDSSPQQCFCIKDFYGMKETFGMHLAYIQHTNLLVIYKTRKNRLQDFRAQTTFHCTTKNSKNTDDVNKILCAGDMRANYSSMPDCHTQFSSQICTSPAAWSLKRTQ